MFSLSFKALWTTLVLLKCLINEVRLVLVASPYLKDSSVEFADWSPVSSHTHKEDMMWKISNTRGRECVYNLSLHHFSLSQIREIKWMDNFRANYDSSTIKTTPSGMWGWKYLWTNLWPVCPSKSLYIHLLSCCWCCWCCLHINYKVQCHKVY